MIEVKKKRCIKNYFPEFEEELEEESDKAKGR